MSKKFNVYDVVRVYAERGVSGYVQIYVETSKRVYIIHAFDEKLKPLLKDLKEIIPLKEQNQQHT